MRRILHIDMDAFFAAVEQKRRPELEGKPVVIGGQGDPSKRGVVSTANYEARKYGVHSAMPMKTAYKLCPQAVYLPVDYQAYSAASILFKEVLKTISPIMEDVGIDEAYLDLSDMQDTNEMIVNRIKTGIKKIPASPVPLALLPTSSWPKLPLTCRNRMVSPFSWRPTLKPSSGRCPSENYMA